MQAGHLFAGISRGRRILCPPCRPLNLDRYMAIGALACCALDLDAFELTVAPLFPCPLGTSRLPFC